MSCFKTLTVGSDLSALDIFLNFEGSPIQASGVNWLIEDSTNTPAASGIALNPEPGKYTASGVVPTGYSYGEWEIFWDITLLDGTPLEASEVFCVNPPTVSIGFTPPQDATANIYISVGVDIGDPNGSVFNENYLRQVLVKAVRRLNHRLGTSRTNRGPVGVPGTFGGQRIRVNEFEVDVEAGTVFPENDEVTDLIIAMMELIILSAEGVALARLHAGSVSGPHVGMISATTNEGISVQNPDGVSVSISPTRLQSRTSMMRFSIEQAEKQMEMMIRAYLSRATGNYGKLIY